MTVYALGDYHGRSIEGFIENEQPFEGDLILSTGDFDNVEVIHEILELKQDTEFIDVGANHDHAMLERKPITSGTLEAQEYSFQELAEELNRDDQARRYLQDLVANPVREFSLGDMSGVLVHGGLDGHIQSPRTPENVKKLWYRLWDDEDYRKNFSAMDRNNYDLMVRGHDHRREHVLSPDTFDLEYGTGDKTYDLGQEGFHLITHGSWYEGDYAVIDEQEETLEFKSI
ncbi:MAG: metallophosphoesterase family protein [Nanohaloarchaea archaeon]|nr:metallophosphoesterase family protein [Candidatus Nanohaloarchaea archaeon]